MRLNLQPSLSNRSNIGQNGQLLIPFKDGGKVNYQKLRKWWIIIHKLASEMGLTFPT